MKRTLVLGAATIFASVAAFPSMTLAAGCAKYDPNCATYPLPKTEAATPTGSVRAEGSVSRTGRMEQRATVRERRYSNDVVGGPVGAAGAVAAGAVTTAGAIATAPFRASNAYAYYNGGYNGWGQESYAERNGFVCTPGTLFKGMDGRMHPCQ
jgi:hypothetical protein